jgi:hypothetical protein
MTEKSERYETQAIDHMIVIIVFLIKPGLKIKVIRHKNSTMVGFELSDSTPEE